MMEKKCLLAGTLIVLSAISFNLLADDLAEADPEDFGGFLFFGAELNALKKNTFQPVVGVTKKHILVDEGVQVERVKRDVPCEVVPRLTLTKKYVHLSDLKYDYTSLAASRAEAQILSDMQRLQTQNDIAMSRVSSAMDEVQNNPTMTAAQKSATMGELNREMSNISEMNSSSQELADEVIQSGELHDAMMNDTIFIKFSLMPEVDASSTYCAMIVRAHGAKDSQGGSIFTRLHYVGDLREGVGQDVKIRRYVGAFPTDSVDVEIILYAQNGEEIATTVSRGIKAVTVKEARLFRKHAGSNI